MTLLLNLLPVCLLLISILLLGPLHQLLTLIAVSLGVLGVSFALLVHGHTWADPSAALLTLIGTKAMWAWRRMSMVLHFMRQLHLGLSGADTPANRHAPHPSLRRSSDIVLQSSQLLEHSAHIVQEHTRLLRTIIDSAPQAMLLQDPQGRALMFNDHMSQLLPPGQLQTGAPVHDALHHLRIDSPATPPDSAPHCISTHNRQGQTRHLLVADTHLTLHDGQALRLLTLVDITEQKELEQQREKTLRLLSHDMRTPAASILAVCDSSRKGQIDTEQARTTIENRAHSLLRLMDDFIVSTQASASTYTFVLTTLDDLIDEALHDTHTLLHSRGMRTALHTDAEPLLVHAAPRLMARVFTNLFMNAIRYGQSGSTIHIHIRLEPGATGAQPAHRACIDITNTIAEKATEPSHTLRGFGLGTPFIQEVVARHGGQVQFDVHHPAGQTARVSLQLPAQGAH